MDDDETGEGCIHMNAGICMHTYACMHACVGIKHKSPSLQNGLLPEKIREHGQWQAEPVGRCVSPRRA